jgi:hypothetical protein
MAVTGTLCRDGLGDVSSLQPSEDEALRALADQALAEQAAVRQDGDVGFAEPDTERRPAALVAAARRGGGRLLVVALGEGAEGGAHAGECACSRVRRMTRHACRGLCSAA